MNGKPHPLTLLMECRPRSDSLAVAFRDFLTVDLSFIGRISPLNRLAARQDVLCTIVKPQGCGRGGSKSRCHAHKVVHVRSTLHLHNDPRAYSAEAEARVDVWDELSMTSPYNIMYYLDL